MEGTIVGNFPQTIQHPCKYFLERACFVDCRGSVVIAGTSMFGYEVKILSVSHDIHEGLGPAVNRRVQIDAGAWVASFAVLFGCWIQHDAIVAAGSCVSGVVVPAHSMVQGNPARMVAQYDLEQKRWIRLAEPHNLEPWEGRR